MGIFRVGTSQKRVRQVLHLSPPDTGHCLYILTPASISAARGFRQRCGRDPDGGGQRARRGHHPQGVLPGPAGAPPAEGGVPAPARHPE